MADAARATATASWRAFEVFMCVFLRKTGERVEERGREGERWRLLERPAHLPDSLYGRRDVIHGPVKLLLRVRAHLADFPHEHIDDGVALELELRNKLFHRCDPVLRRHLRPLTLALVPRSHCSIKSLQRLCW